MHCWPIECVMALLASKLLFLGRCHSWARVEQHCVKFATFNHNEPFNLLPLFGFGVV